MAKRSVIELAAVKIIDRQKAPQDYQEKFMPRELKHWPRLRHPNLTALTDWFQVTYCSALFTFSISVLCVCVCVCARARHGSVSVLNVSFEIVLTARRYAA